VAAFLEQLVSSNNNDLSYCREQLCEQRSLTCQQARMAAQELQERLNMLRSQTGISSESLPPHDEFDAANMTIFDESNFSCSASLVRGDQVPMVGIGLHYGDCTYGNIGTPRRLDFTVIGPSVNLASCVESLCSKLGANVLATTEFIEHDCADIGVLKTLWKNRGAHAVEGFEEPITVFELHPV
jgi:hypothetical protein